MCKTIEVSFDKDEIKSILKEDYNQVIFDGCPSFDDFIPDTSNSLWFKLKLNGALAGLIKLDSLNFTTWIPHIIIKRECRKYGSEDWGKQVVEYMGRRFKKVSFLVMTPNVAAKKYAQRMGFELRGILPGSIKINGQLKDQYILW